MLAGTSLLLTTVLKALLILFSLPLQWKSIRGCLFFFGSSIEFNMLCQHVGVFKR